MLYMCIFCQIANHEIPAHILYEDELVMAFLDLSQATKGHTLLIPKQHYQNFLECDTAILKHMSEVAKQLGNEIVTKFQAKGLNVLSNVNEVAGQTIMHFHMHLLPRYQEDDLTITFKENPNANKDLTEAFELFSK